MTDVTLCKNCEHFVNKGRDRWYDHICTAPETQKPDRTNYVSGDTERDVTHCREVNNGACPHFSVAVIPPNVSSIWRRYGA